MVICFLFLVLPLTEELKLCNTFHADLLSGESCLIICKQNSERCEPEELSYNKDIYVHI